MDLTLKMVDGSIDATAYEDALRDYFTLDAFRMSTVDKLASALVRQVGSRPDSLLETRCNKSISPARLRLLLQCTLTWVGWYSCKTCWTAVA